MSYTALYRRWRPTTFDTLVGQAHIGRTLAAAIAKDSFVHAYLFCGPRGTGKTSTARILARAINCEQPTATGDACGSCAACLRDQQGESMDMIEIDGASNRGIDEIRDLRERVKYAPVQEKYKIYIIDEVHMLTNDAFNALLKTLEEPPGHVVFIFATTAPHKLPPTVVSRCQRFDFRRISDADICQHLLNIAAAEGIPLDEDAAALIAKKAEGGMRDAVSLLDQCAGTREGQIDIAAVTALLGVVDRSFILELLHQLLQKDISAVLGTVAQLYAEGKDLRQAVDDLLEVSRDLLLSQVDKKKQPDVAVPEWAAAFAPGSYLAVLQALSDVDAKMRYALSPRITLELALIRICGVVEEAPAAAKTARPSAAPRPSQAAKASPAAKAGAEKNEPPAKPVEKTTLVQKPNPAAAPAVQLADVQASWPEILKRIEQKNAGAHAILREAVPTRIEQHKLFLEFPPAMGIFINSILSPNQYKTLIENTVNSVLRAALSIDGYIGAERELQPLEDAAPAEQVNTPTVETQNELF